MSLTASKLYMGWTGVTATTTASTPVVYNVDEVNEMKFQIQGEAKRWYADASPFAKAVVVRNKVRRIVLKGGDVGILLTIPGDAGFTLVAILNDLKNGVSTGAITMTAVGCVVVESPFEGKVNEYATGDITIEATSPDGTTDPITFVVAT